MQVVVAVTIWSPHHLGQVHPKPMHQLQALTGLDQTWPTRRACRNHPGNSRHKNVMWLSWAKQLMGHCADARALMQAYTSGQIMGLVRRAATCTHYVGGTAARQRAAHSRRCIQVRGSYGIHLCRHERWCGLICRCGLRACMHKKKQHQHQHQHQLHNTTCERRQNRQHMVPANNQSVGTQPYQ
jgi:hypothetical protein